MNTEISAIMDQSGRVLDWANAVKYSPAELSAEDKEISAVTDAWVKELGKTGYDKDHELSALITKTFTPETVSAPSELIDMLFDTDSIGEFDDYRVTVDPKNTIEVYDAITGGNVPRSFIDHKVLKPTFCSLQAETSLKLEDIRRGGYKSVANMITNINEAFELARVTRILDILDKALAGGENVFTETGATPTEEICRKLATYLMDVTNGETPAIFGQNKYIVGMTGLQSAQYGFSDAVKNQYNKVGKLDMYAGCRLFGLSGVKKLANGDFIIPDKRLFAAAGKIGKVITRGETRTYQETDINNEQIHIKVGGYSFGTVVTDISKAAKVVYNQ
jgi:hypothetical protein